MTIGDEDLRGAALDWVRSLVGPVSATRELTGGTTSTMLALTTVAGGAEGELVLRLVTEEPWRSHGSELVTRESQVQSMLATTDVPAPRPIATDAGGAVCGVAAHLMTLLPGAVDDHLVDTGSPGLLADLLAGVHAVDPDVDPDVDVRGYQSWAWEAKYVVPAWASDHGLWEESFALLRTDPPAYEPCFLHRDFQPRNVLWSGARPSGLVDWVETSVGPAWLDVAHCCTNLALRHGDGAADGFADAYVARTGRPRQGYFDVMDVVGFLPPPGGRPSIRDPAEQSRLEQRLRTVLQRLPG